MVKSDFKIAIIGCGNIAKAHMYYILENVSEDNVVVCDFYEPKARIFAAQFNVKNYFSSVEKMLTESRPNICHILTPPQTHADIAVKCLKNGAHVLIEKPMAITLSDADKIIEMAQKMNKLGCVNHQLTLQREIVYAKQILDSNTLGPPVCIRAFWGTEYLKILGEGINVRWSSDMPGGYFFDLLPHIVSIYEVLAPDFQVRSAHYAYDDRFNISDLYGNCFSSTQGIELFLHISLRTRFHNHIYILCQRGEISIDLRKFTVIISKKLHFTEFLARPLENLNTAYQITKETIKSVFCALKEKLKSYKSTGTMIKLFYDAVLNERPSPFPPDKGKDIIKKSLDIIAMAEAKKIVLPLNKTKTIDSGFSDVRILVTGGTGLIGRYLVERLVESGQKVRVLSRGHRSNDFQNRNNIEMIKGDICDQKTVDRVMQGIEVVYHLAAGTKGDWSQFFDSTVLGTENIIHSAILHKVKKIVYISSLSVYDQSNFSNNSIIREDFPYEKKEQLRGYYSASKLEAERLVVHQMNEKNLNVCILRPGLVYVSEKPHLPAILSYIIKTKWVKILFLIDDKKRRLNLISVENLVDAIKEAGENEKANGVILNIVDNGNITLKGYMKLYKKYIDRKMLIIYFPIKILVSIVKSIELFLKVFLKKELSISYRLVCASRNVSFNTEKVKNILNWKSRISLEESLQKLRLQK